MSTFRRSILDRIGSVADVWLDEDPAHERLVTSLKWFTKNRPSDTELIMSDLRRAMLRSVDTLPDDVRTSIQRQLEAVPESAYERRLGLSEPIDVPGQLQLFTD